MKAIVAYLFQTDEEKMSYAFSDFRTIGKSFVKICCISILYHINFRLTCYLNYRRKDVSNSRRKHKQIIIISKSKILPKLKEKLKSCKRKVYIKEIILAENTII